MINVDNKTFSVERGELVMHANPESGRRREPYRHACPLAALEAIAHTIDEAGEDGIDRRELHAKSGTTHTQTAVAMAFLVERGIVGTIGRRESILHSGGGCHLDTMTEYHALREERATSP